MAELTNWEQAGEQLIGHPGGLNRKMLAHYAGIPEEAVAGAMASLRERADDIGEAPVCICVNGEYLYVYASLYNHWRQARRRYLVSSRTSARRQEKIAAAAYMKFGNLECQAAELEARHLVERIEMELARLDA